MDQSERDGLKDNLRAMVAGRGDGIDLDTPQHWVIEAIKQPEPFFEYLQLLLPPDSILYFEGCTIAPDVAAFYESKRARNPVAVIRDIISPVPDTYHVEFSPEVIAQLQDFLRDHQWEQLFNHVKAYRGDVLLFTFHDAFFGWLRISEHVPESAVLEFCLKLGVTSQKELTQKRGREALQHLLDVMEGKKPLRFAHEKWWQRLWRRIRGR